jgi:hypothetical protein
MPTAKVVVAACRTAGGADLYPDADWQLLRTALEDRGALVERWSWDDDAAPWDAADLVVVRSTWDSVDRPEEFLEWIRGTSSLVALANPAEVMTWNLDKRHLLDVEDAGLPVVPTLWSRPGDGWRAPDYEFVVKPAISGGGRSTARYEPHEQAQARAHVDDLHRAGQVVMTQRYLEAVDDTGEMKMVFIGGRFSHSTCIGPLLDRGTGVLETPWDKPVHITVEEPSDEQRQLGEAIISYVRERHDVHPVYARVDVVGRSRPQLLELELVDPSLSLWARPIAADDLAEAVVSLATQP